MLVNSRRGTWKVKAIQQGLDRARIWVGDYGRWKPALVGAPSDAFRKGPSFDVRASFETDRKWNDKLIALYDKKYGDDFSRWHEDMQTGFYSGERKLIRYEPIDIREPSPHAFGSLRGVVGCGRAPEVPR